MQNEKKYLGQASLNADDVDFSLGPNDVVNCEGFRTGTTDNGVINTLESINGTVLIPNPLLPVTGTNIGIGGADDLSSRRRILFNWNSEGQHGIYCFDWVSQKMFTVLLSKDVVGGLNFSQYNFIDAARVANGCVYWAISISEPCRVDINAGINLYQPGTFPAVLPYTAPLNFPVARLIRRPPGLPPTSVRTLDANFVNNFVQYEAMQFAWRYQYRDYEISKSSPLSTTSNYNREIDNYNRIDVTLPIGEQIDQDVIRVDLIAYYINSATYYIIKSWSSITDAAAIAAHNAGNPLTYAFFNDVFGIALDFTDLTTPYDTVPVKCQALEVARNRLFLGNYIAGYDTPAAGTSAVITPKAGIAGQVSVTGLWVQFGFQSNCNGFVSNFTQYYLDVEDISGKTGYYFYVPQFNAPAFPASVEYSLLQYIGPGIQDIMTYYARGCQNHQTTFSNNLAPLVTVLNAPTPPFAIGQSAMKSDATYQASVTFYDYARRKSGVVVNPNKLYIPDRNYSQVNFTVGIDWALSNANAINEIPDWAYYYSINLTKCQRTRFFVQLRAANATYATKDATGAYVFNTPAYTPKLLGCAFDISNLLPVQMGYVYNPGDIIKIYILGGGNYQLAITGNSGNWITTELKNIGNLDANTKILFEIYTPYRPTATEPYFEQGQVFSIVNPTTPSRAYSIANGTFPGDITLLNRNDGTVDYLTEAMSPNDKMYKNWNTNAGMSNLIDTIGQVHRGDSVTYSETFIQGSRTNGLSTFKALNVKDIPSDLGNILKLQLASKVQLEGTIMLAICDGGETASMYLSERTLTSSVGDTAIMGIDEVIGTVNPLKGSRGTINPESVSEYRGNIRWFDAQNGAWVQYSANGLYDISELKMTRFWNLYGAQYRSMTPQQIEALGNRPFIPSCVDTYHDELLMSLPRLLQDPPKGYLPDQPDVVYPFDIYDGRGKTILCSVTEELNTYGMAVVKHKWQGSLPFVADSMFSIENNFYSVYQGNVYQHNVIGKPGNFYGIQYNAKVMTVAIQMPSKPKSYNNVSVESNMAPANAYFMTRYPNVQASDLIPLSWTNKEGVYYANLLRNKLDPKWLPDMETALLRGEKMRATALYAMYEFDVSGGICNVKFINFGYAPSLGHTTI